MGLITFCLITLVGILPVGLRNNQVATSDTAASSLSREIESDLCNTPTATGTTTSISSTIFGLQVPAAGQSSTMTAPQTLFINGAGLPTTAAQALYRVAVAFVPPASGHTTTNVRIVISWPAQADPIPATWPTHASGSYEILTALDRN